MNEDVTNAKRSGFHSQVGAGSNQSIYGTVNGGAALTIGYASAPGGEKNNEDCFGVVTSQEMPEASERGLALAVADGGSATGNGRIAAEMTVRTLLQDFYATPVDWGAERAIERVLSSVNDWLFVQNSRDPDLDGIVTTLSMLLIREDKYHLAHVGDSRVYRRRNNELQRLTIDHTWPRRDMRHVLRRAVGLDSHLVVDISAGELLPGDVFLLASDGVWEVLGHDAIDGLLASDMVPETIARALVDGSLQNQRQYMGRNDATALVVKICSVGGNA